MDSLPEEIVFDLPGFIRAYRDGRCERFMGTGFVAAGTDAGTGVRSKDVVISPAINLSGRLYVPAAADGRGKLPVLIYFHGGGFVVESAFSPTYHTFLNLLVAEANAVVVSVDYHVAPEYPLPIAYTDSWAAVSWAASHANGSGPESWLNDYADLDSVFFGGDSAGGNIAHNMAIRVGTENLPGLNLTGIVLIHPFFWGKDPIGAERDVHRHAKERTDSLWQFANPSSAGTDDPLLNPAKDPNLGGLGCARVLVCVAEKDVLRDRGRHYEEAVGKSGWKGKVEVMEAVGEGHVFFLFDPSSDNAVAMRKKIGSFVNLIQSKA